MKEKVIIGSRGSDLALWQANFAKERLQQKGVNAQIKVIKTQGDRQQNVAFSQMEGKGFFTKEIEQALLNHEVDLAVHSHKDLGTTSPKGLTVAGVSDRADPSELLIIHPESLDTTQRLKIKANGVVGTSSPRRLVQMQAFRPDVSFETIRGNVNTRLQKLRDRKYDAILLAKAGISRLKLPTDDLHVEQLQPHVLVPSPAQGVLAYQVRQDDDHMVALVRSITDKDTEERIGWEREVLRLFEAGCQMPIGVYCHPADDQDYHYDMWIAKADEEGELPFRTRFRISNGQTSVKQLVANLREPRPHTVFISRHLESDSIMKRILHHYNYEVSHQSLIDFQLVKFSSIPPTDWIFFSSKNAVSFFLDQKPKLPAGVKLGVISNGSARELQKYGFEPDFNGAKSPVNQVAEAFGKQADYQSVLFPQASNSLRSIQEKLPGSIRVHNLVVYDNSPKTDFEVPSAEILVFTSPLNVSTYFKKYDPQPNQHIIAIGSTTGSKLAEYGVMNYKVAYQPEELSLLDEIMSI